jgi:hypothetical protein
MPINDVRSSRTPYCWFLSDSLAHRFHVSLFTSLVPQVIRETGLVFPWWENTRTDGCLPTRVFEAISWAYGCYF